MQTTNLAQNRITVVAPLLSEKASLEPVVAALSLPLPELRQPDLQYNTGVFVSTGMNKNGAVFLGSELYKAQSSIINKAVDIEHEERLIVGQITAQCFMDRQYKAMSMDEIGSLSTNDMDGLEMDVAVSCIIHKARFPEIAEQIFAGELALSMECYYRDYDVKVGDLVIPRAQASRLGYDKLIGSVVKVRDGAKELGFHLVGRVLRDIHFAGVGLVRQPANERSIILESAAMKEFVDSQKETAAIIDLSEIATLEISSENESRISDIADVVRTVIREELSGVLKKEDSTYIPANTRPGTCVNYKRYVYSYPDDSLPEPANDTSQYPLYTNAPADTLPVDAKVVSEHHCSLFGIECSARPGDATMPTCWRNVFARTVKDELQYNYEEIVRRSREKDADLVELQKLIDEARKFRQ